MKTRGEAKAPSIPRGFRTFASLLLDLLFCTNYSLCRMLATLKSMLLLYICTLLKSLQSIASKSHTFIVHT